MATPRQVGPITVLVAALLVNLPLAHGWWTSHRLEGQGIEVTATVQEARAIPWRGNERRFFVAYRLPEDVDPRQRDFTGEVDRATYDEATVSERIRVTYLPGDPAENRPVGGVDGGWLGVFLTLVADLALLAILGLMLWARRGRRELVLLATADVVRCRPQAVLEQVGEGEYVVRGDVVERSGSELTIAVGDRRVRVLLGDHVNPVGHQQPAEARGRELPRS